MITLVVDIKVRADALEAWKAATLENARSSRKEAGVVSFDLLEDRDDPSHFLLIEVYRDEAAVGAHKGTPHYAKWAALAEPLQAEPRTRAFYRTLGV